jgi:hypothetical protein
MLRRWYVQDDRLRLRRGAEIRPSAAGAGFAGPLSGSLLAKVAEVRAPRAARSPVTRVSTRRAFAIKTRGSYTAKITTQRWSLDAEIYARICAHACEAISLSVSRSPPVVCSFTTGAVQSPPLTAAAPASGRSRNALAFEMTSLWPASPTLPPPGGLSMKCVFEFYARRGRASGGFSIVMSVGLLVGRT